MATKIVFPVFLLLFAACGPQAPEQGDTEGASTSSGDTSGGPAPGTTTGEPTAPDTMTSSEVPTTTGTEGTCPIGQPTLAPVWSTLLAPEPNLELSLSGPPAVLSDGRIAVAGEVQTLDVPQRRAPALFWVARDGQPLGLVPGQLGELNHITPLAMEVADDDSVVLAGPAGTDFGELLPFISRFAPGGPEQARAKLQTESLTWPVDLALYAGDTAVVLGHDWPDHDVWLARVEIETGAALWELQLPAASVAKERTRGLAVGPGGEIVVGSGQWPNGDFPELKIHRVDEAGVVVWTRDLFEPGPHAGEFADIVVTGDGQAIVLTRWRLPDHKISATSLDLTSGETLWEVDVAGETGDGPPNFTRALLDADALSLPIARGAEPGDGLPADPLAVELHRVSLQGELLGATPLPLAGREAGHPLVTAARGSCGDLIVMQEDRAMPSWLGSFAP